MTEAGERKDAEITLSFNITGQFPGDTFPDWVLQRALKLDLKGWVKRHDNSRIEIKATGHRVLVEALQAACALGPMNASVDSIASCQMSTNGGDSAFVILRD